MNFKDIKKKYPKEWVLIEYEKLQKDLSIKAGKVVAHSPNKDEIYKALSQSFGSNVSLEYTGPVESDLTVMSRNGVNS